MNGSDAIDINYVDSSWEKGWVDQAEADYEWSLKWKQITGAVDAVEGEEKELAPSYQNDVSLREQASRYGQW